MKSNNKYEAKKYVAKVTPEQKVRAHLSIRYDCNVKSDTSHLHNQLHKSKLRFYFNNHK